MDPTPKSNQQNRNNESERVIYFRNKIFSKGALNIFYLIKAFKNVDFNNSQTVSHQDFYNILMNLNCDFNENEILNLFGSFDIKNIGYISYIDFIRIIRGQLDDNRKKYVSNVFKFLTSSLNPKIKELPFSYLISKFSPENHPDLLTDMKTKEQIIHEFKTSFEINHIFYCNKALVDGVTEEEFIEYYSFLGPFSSTEKHFFEIIDSAWRSPSSEVKVAIPQSKKQYRLQKVKKILLAKIIHFQGSRDIIQFNKSSLQTLKKFILKLGKKYH